jgi:porin
MSLTRCLLLASITGVLAVGAAAVRAQTTPSAETAAPPPSVLPALSAGPFGFLSASANSSNLMGDMGGLRPALDKYGITLNITENAETFGNLTGGVQQGFEANGLTTVQLQLDTEKAFDLNGGLFNVSGLHIWAAI